MSRCRSNQWRKSTSASYRVMRTSIGSDPASLTPSTPPPMANGPAKVGPTGGASGSWGSGNPMVNWRHSRVSGLLGGDAPLGGAWRSEGDPLVGSASLFVARCCCSSLMLFSLMLFSLMLFSLMGWILVTG